MLGDIEPITAQEFMRQMKEISKEERENQTNEKWFCNLPTKEKARFFPCLWVLCDAGCEATHQHQ